MEHDRGRGLDALATVMIAGGLVLVATVRLLSYHRGPLGLWVQQSFIGLLAYQPDSLASVRFFKILATPAFAAVVYFGFRIMNRGQRMPAVNGYVPYHEDLDFGSAWVRLAILAVINAHWVVLEAYKFYTRGYPYSALESLPWNAAVLAVGGLISFFAMKHASFGPVFRD